MARWPGVFLALALGLGLSVRAADSPKPNVVLIYADDLGYGDLGCFGSKTIATPHLDRMAREGLRFTSFYVAQAVCSASRTALLTGCYPNRLGILGALNPDSKIGISDSETTLAQVFKTRGYATMIIGKWHLGHHPPFLPTRHGFDRYFGIPYSNDMGPGPKNDFPLVPLFENERIIERNPDMRQITTRYTEQAVAFLEANRDKPFFLYVPHTMPHVPLGVSDKFAGKSASGLYGDVIEEIDWSTGRILETLKRLGLDERTLVLFTSDNGPWLVQGNHGGSAGPLREGKTTAFEGGVREPAIARWPGHVPAGTTTTEPVMTIDILPTLAHLIGAEVPREHKIDGLDVTPILTGQPGAHCPHESLWFYWSNELHAIRAGRWKLHFPHPYPTVEPVDESRTRFKTVPTHIELSLFDLETDVGETTNVAADHPDVVEKLKALGEKAREDLGDSLTKRPGSGKRVPGRVSAAADH